MDIIIDKKRVRSKDSLYYNVQGTSAGYDIFRNVLFQLSEFEFVLLMWEFRHLISLFTSVHVSTRRWEREVNLVDLLH